MTRKEFILRACLSMSSNALFESIHQYGNIPINTDYIVDCAIELADNVEGNLGHDTFDSDDNPNMADSLCDIADNIDDIKESLRELLNK